jgi:hypothetical protein
MREFQDRLIRPVKFLIDLCCRGLFYSTNIVEHFRERKLKHRKDRLSQVVKKGRTVELTIALSVFPCRPFVDRVRTAAIRSRYPYGHRCSKRYSRQSSLSGRTTCLTFLC